MGKINNDYLYLYFREGENDKIYRYKLKVSCNLKKLINGENFEAKWPHIMFDVLEDNKFGFMRYLCLCNKDKE